MKQVFYTLIVLWCFLFQGNAQNRLWVSTGANTTINKKWNFEARFTGRFYDNQRWDKFFPEFSVKYKVHKYFKPDIDYRYVINQSRNNHRITTGHRINLNFNSGVDVDRFDFKFRFRLQYKFDRFLSTDDYEPDFDNAARIKSTVKYNIKGSKIDPRLENEIFYNTNHGQFGRQFTKYRFGIGADIKLPNRNVITVKYRYDHEFNVSNPRRFHILSIAHDYTYKRPKKKSSSSRI
jgi:hypothetical protein